MEFSRNGCFISVNISASAEGGIQGCTVVSAKNTGHQEES
jgi:hypothetical protein